MQLQSPNSMLYTMKIGKSIVQTVVAPQGETALFQWTPELQKNYTDGSNEDLTVEAYCRSGSGDLNIERDMTMYKDRIIGVRGIIGIVIGVLVALLCCVSCCGLLTCVVVSKKNHRTSEFDPILGS